MPEVNLGKNRYGISTCVCSFPDPIRFCQSEDTKDRQTRLVFFSSQKVMQTLQILFLPGRVRHKATKIRLRLSLFCAVCYGSPQANFTSQSSTMLVQQKEVFVDENSFCQVVSNAGQPKGYEPDPLAQTS